MRKYRIFYLTIFLLLILCLSGNLAKETYAYANTCRAPIDVFWEHYDTNRVFKDKVNFVAIVLLLVFTISILAACCGVGLATIWAFIGGFFIMEIIASVASKVLKFDVFNIYGFFACFFVGLWCAYSVEFKRH